MYTSTKIMGLKALALFFLAIQVEAFWRMPCMSRSGLARIDPLVSYGTLSEHAHAIHGSSGFSETAGHAELMAGSCTSCEVSQDKSAYWTPAFYFQDAKTGQFELVTQEGGMLAYYLLYPNAGDETKTVHGFPAGFQMIAGDTNQRNFTYPIPDIQKSDWSGVYTTQAFLRQAALGFNCLNYAAAPEGSLYRHFLPDKAYLDANCKDGIRMELMFPSCWNGALDSPDHKSHVAYPSQVMTGDCPPEFPQRLVSLFYETIWRTEDFVGRDGQFVLANGDPTGMGYHGDFVMGWDEKFLQSAVDTCRDDSGRIEDCPLFTIQPSSVYSNCDIAEPAALANEKVLTGLSTLPGNPAIVAGPGYASGVVAGGPGSNNKPSSGASPAVTPTLSHSAGSTIASSETYAPGAVFQMATSSAAAVVQAAVVGSPTPAPAPAQDDGKSYFSTDYHTAGNTVNEVLWVEEVVTITLPQDTTTVFATATGAADGEQGKKRHLNRHRGLGI